MNEVALWLLIAAVFTPLLLAGLGELMAQRAGVINYGLDGQLAMAAASGLMVGGQSDSLWLALGAALLASLALSLLFALLSQRLAVRSIYSGLSVLLIGAGLAGYLRPIAMASQASPAMIDGVKYLVLALCVLSLVLAVACAYFLLRTPQGLRLRLMGDNPQAAARMGISVLNHRSAAIVFAGLCAGLAGGLMGLFFGVYSPVGYGFGYGWLALALVSYSLWRPGYLCAGVLIFTVLIVLVYYLTSDGKQSQLLWLFALPYLAALVGIVGGSGGYRQAFLNKPKALGQAFVPDISGN